MSRVQLNSASTLGDMNGVLQLYYQEMQSAIAKMLNKQSQDGGKKHGRLYHAKHYKESKLAVKALTDLLYPTTKSGRKEYMLTFENLYHAIGFLHQYSQLSPAESESDGSLSSRSTSPSSSEHSSSEDGNETNNVSAKPIKNPYVQAMLLQLDNIVRRTLKELKQVIYFSQYMHGMTSFSSILNAEELPGAFSRIDTITGEEFEFIADALRECDTEVVGGDSKLVGSRGGSLHERADYAVGKSLHLPSTDSEGGSLSSGGSSRASYYTGFAEVDWTQVHPLHLPSTASESSKSSNSYDPDKYDDVFSAGSESENSGRYTSSCDGFHLTPEDDSRCRSASLSEKDLGMFAGSELMRARKRSSGSEGSLIDAGLFANRTLKKAGDFEQLHRSDVQLQHRFSGGSI
jgi:hypothetical protein